MAVFQHFPCRRLPLGCGDSTFITPARLRAHLRPPPPCRLSTLERAQPDPTLDHPCCFRFKPGLGCSFLPFFNAIAARPENPAGLAGPARKARRPYIPPDPDPSPPPQPRAHFQLPFPSWSLPSLNSRQPPYCDIQSIVPDNTRTVQHNNTRRIVYHQTFQKRSPDWELQVEALGSRQSKLRLNKGTRGLHINTTHIHTHTPGGPDQAQTKTESQD